MTDYIWIGKYETDIKYSKLFKKSITIFGSNSGNNFSYVETRNIESFTYGDFIKFVFETLSKIELTNCQLIFYNPKWERDIISLYPELNKYSINKNSIELLEFLNNKIMSKTWISSYFNVPPFIISSRDECNYEQLKSSFPSYESFVIQKDISEAGKGTIIIDKANESLPKSFIDFTYIASPNFINSISLNTTIICYNDGYLQFPTSRQVLSSEYQYCGSDFISGDSVYIQYKKEIDQLIDSIAKHLMQLGYIGICGIDYLVYNDELYFIEFNPRFQGSSFLLDYALNKRYNISLYQLQIDALKGGSVPETAINANELKINLSFFNELIPNSNNPFVEILIDGKQHIKKRYISDVCQQFNKYEITSNDYYNYFAEKYKYILSDYENLITQEGSILKHIFEKYAKREVHSILDCTCGIGIQTISLAKLEYEVYGSDLSEKEINVADFETKKANLNVTYNVCDCRNLKRVYKNKKFDAIISVDSALPHLLTENDLKAALESISNQLKKDGIFIASFRDYDLMLKEKPQWAYPQRITKLSDRDIVVVRSFDWNNDICTSHQYYIEKPKNKKPVLFYNTYKQWAITREKMLEIAKNCSFKNCFWAFPEETGFYQPIFCGII